MLRRLESRRRRNTCEIFWLCVPPGPGLVGPNGPGGPFVIKFYFIKFKQDLKENSKLKGLNSNLPGGPLKVEFEKTLTIVSDLKMFLNYLAVLVVLVVLVVL